MAAKTQPRKRTAAGPPGGRRKSCHFCKDKVADVDYKNVNQLRRYISEKGKIRNRRITGACRRHQRQVAVGREAGPRDGASAVRAGVVMEVILTSDVEKLGLKGEVVDVKRGYARNYLLPRRLAEVATPGRIAEIRRIDEERARHEARSADQAAEIAETLTKTVLRFEVKAGPTGALFGSVTPTDIAEELWRTRKIRVDRRKIDLDVIKRIGRFTIPVHVFEGVTAEVKTLVVPEGGELPPEEELAALEAAERAEAEAAEAAHAEALRETEAALAEEDALRTAPGDEDVDTAVESTGADESLEADEADATDEAGATDEADEA